MDRNHSRTLTLVLILFFSFQDRGLGTLLGEKRRDGEGGIGRTTDT